MDLSNNTYVKVIQEMSQLFQKFQYINNGFIKMMGFGAKVQKMLPDGTVYEE